MESSLRAGRVVSFDPVKGDGLIAPFGSDEHVPFRAQAIRFVDIVAEGQPVIYAIERAGVNTQAVEVRPA
ncbi:cold-shock protein [Streptomyces tauricus]|uniref:cold-shock protein n=1 Tax=Streptomyces tauricus TaxID=68274 RepID=UPI00341FAFDE